MTTFSRPPAAEAEALATAGPDVLGAALPAGAPATDAFAAALGAGVEGLETGFADPPHAAKQRLRAAAARSADFTVVWFPFRGLSRIQHTMGHGTAATAWSSKRLVAKQATHKPRAVFCLRPRTLGAVGRFLIFEVQDDDTGTGLG